MRNIRAFLRLLAGWFSTVRNTALCATLITAVFLTMHLLGLGTVRELGYTLMLIGAGLAITAIASFVRFNRRQHAITEAIRHLPPEEADLPNAGNAMERSFRALADAYRTACNRDSSHATAAERERLDYFTLWVHQIKTPIAALDLMAQSEQPTDRELLRQEVFKIGQYADAALAYQRLQSIHNDLVLTSVPLYPLCAAAVKRLRPLFLYRKIALNMEPFAGAALSDAKWLGMAVTQVLTNSLKYTPAGGSVTVELWEPLVLRIRDTGVGIPPEDLPRVFERGFTGRLGRTEREGEKSTGIGLYLCRQTCDKLGHKVSITSTPGVGTTVTFDLRRDQYDAFT
jgi:signal transduction histidine kinase